MATSKGQVTLRGRFPSGSVVKLVKVKHEGVLRAAGGKEIATGTVGDDGSVTFGKDVEVGGRYFVTGYVDGFPLEVRARGGKAGDESAVLSQPPVTADRTRLADGTFLDEPPEQHQAAGFGGVGPAPGQHQVPKGTPQRSDTPRGTAHPVDVNEKAPYPSQSDVGKDVPQRSSTELGQATPIVHDVPASQEDSNGIPQRSDTPLGVVTPIPAGDAVQAQLDRESADAKAAIGEPGKAAALPAKAASKSAPRKRASAKKPAKKSRAKATAAKSTRKTSAAKKPAAKTTSTRKKGK